MRSVDVSLTYEPSPDYIQICVEHDPPEPQDTTKAIGVDLGRRDIAHTSEGENWNGQQLNQVRDHYSRLRAVLQRKASQVWGLL